MSKRIGSEDEYVKYASSVMGSDKSSRCPTTSPARRQRFLEEFSPPKEYPCIVNFNTWMPDTNDGHPTWEGICYEFVFTYRSDIVALLAMLDAGEPSVIN